MFSLIKIRKNRKGFTLIELLVVIAIIAVLSVVVILTLNPAELLKQARDSNRISDMATLKSAISLYLADVSNPSLGINKEAYFSTSATTTYATASTATTTWGLANGTSTGQIATTTRSTDGTGWLPVNFTAISSGAPIGSLPVDPVNIATSTIANNDNSISSGTWYGYLPSGTSFKLVTHMESKKYTTTGSADVESTDGGISTTTYEQGTSLNL